jgi:hypothetical protein
MASNTPSWPGRTGSGARKSSEITLVFISARIEQIARQHQEAGILAQGIGHGADHVGSRLAQPAGSRPSSCRRPVIIAMQQPGAAQLAHHRRHAAGTVEGLAQISCRPVAC